MSAASRIAGLFVVVALAGCAAPKPPQNYVVLLDDGAPGALRVETAAGARILERPGEAAAIPDVARAPEEVALGEAAVREIWGAALAHEPPAPVTFVLHFALESATLTPESRDRLPEVLEAARTRPAPEVVIVGHTDRSGPPEHNFRLGLRRAQAARRLLLAAGLPAETVEIDSYGAAQPLIDNGRAFEPDNRRVEITVR